MSMMPHFSDNFFIQTKTRPDCLSTIYHAEWISRDNLWSFIRVHCKCIYHAEWISRDNLWSFIRVHCKCIYRAKWISRDNLWSFIRVHCKCIEIWDSKLANFYKEILIPLKLCIFTKFGTVNWSLKVFFVSMKSAKKFLILHDIIIVVHCFKVEIIIVWFQRISTPT